MKPLADLDSCQQSTSAVSRALHLLQTRFKVVPDVLLLYCCYGFPHHFPVHGCASVSQIHKQKTTKNRGNLTGVSLVNLRVNSVIADHLVLSSLSFRFIPNEVSLGFEKPTEMRTPSCRPAPLRRMGPSATRRPPPRLVVFTRPRAPLTDGALRR